MEQKNDHWGKRWSKGAVGSNVGSDSLFHFMSKFWMLFPNISVWAFIIEHYNLGCNVLFLPRTIKYNFYTFEQLAGSCTSSVVPSLNKGLNYCQKSFILWTYHTHKCVERLFIGHTWWNILMLMIWGHDDCVLGALREGWMTGPPCLASLAAPQG